MIKTKPEVVTQTMGLWALPKQNKQPGEFPFTYELYGTTYHWRNDAILVTQAELRTTVPEGVDLFAMALETLTHKEAEALKTYKAAVAAIDEVRKQMLMLEAPKVVEPEYMEMNDPIHQETIVDILVRRDGMDRSDAADMLADARLQVAEGADPAEVLHDTFGLEPDYIFELLEK